MGFLTGLSLKNWLIIGGIVAALVAVGAIYAKGRSDEAAGATIKQQTETIDTLRTRNKTDDEINSADDASLCAALGRVFSNSACQ